MGFCYARRAFVSITTAAFYLLAIFTAGSALGVALTHNIVYSAFALMYLGPPNPKYESTGWEISGRELFTLVPLAAIILFLGIYPKAILNLQSPRLVEIAQQVKAAAAPRVAAR